MIVKSVQKKYFFKYCLCLKVEIHEGRFLLDAADISRWTMRKKLASLVTAPLTDELVIRLFIDRKFSNLQS